MDKTCEQVVMSIISSAGESKARAFDALKRVKEGDYDDAREALKESRELDLEAHEAQTALITAELAGGDDRPELNLLLVHAQDHYMCAALARDLIEALTEVFESKEEQ